MFKVGDWVVRYLDNDEIYTNVKCAKISKVEQDHYVINLPFGGFVTYKSEHLKLWQPKEGEWCWIDEEFAKYIKPYFCIKPNGNEIKRNSKG